jgi:hypothetical protein
MSFFEIISTTKLIKRNFFYLHFCLSIPGPLQQADIPQAISLKSIWLSQFSSKALNNPEM